MQIFGNTPYIRPTTQNESGQAAKPVASSGGNFSDILTKQIAEKDSIQFSKHAEMRLQSRSIQLSEEQLNRIEEGVGKAKEKGIKDSLVLLDNLAFVVNTRNNIVITAMAKDGDQQSVFTKIDGAVIV